MAVPAPCDVGKYEQQVVRQSQAALELSTVQAAMIIQFYWRRALISRRLTDAGVRMQAMLNIRQRHMIERRSTRPIRAATSRHQGSRRLSSLNIFDRMSGRTSVTDRRASSHPRTPGASAGSASSFGNRV